MFFGFLVRSPIWRESRFSHLADKVAQQRNKFSMKNVSVESSQFSEQFRLEIFLRQTDKKYDAIRISKVLKALEYKTLKLKTAMFEKTNKHFGYSRKKRQINFQKFAVMKLKRSALSEKQFFSGFLELNNEETR